jgi:hypothetical protein
VLGGVADEPDGDTGGGSAGQEPVEGAVADSGGFVDDEHGTGVEGVVTGVAEPVEVPGEGFGEYPALVAEVAGGFGFHGGAEHPVAGGLPGGDSGAHGVGLAGARPSDGGLSTVPGGAELGDEPELLSGEFGEVDDGGVEHVVVDGAGAGGDASPEVVEDAGLEGEHVGGGVLGLVLAAYGEGGAVGPVEGVAAGGAFELDDVGGAEQFVGELFKGGGRDDERAVTVGVGEVDQGGEQVAAGEDRPVGGHGAGGRVKDAGPEPG